MSPSLGPSSAESAESNPFTMSDGILLILDALESDQQPRAAQRTLLEGLASIARLPHMRSSTCPALATFKKDDWLVCLHESLAYLQQMDRIEQTSDGFELTHFGRERLRGDLAAWSPGQGVDYSNVRHLASRVREGLGLGSAIKQEARVEAVPAGR